MVETAMKGLPTHQEWTQTEGVWKKNHPDHWMTNLPPEPQPAPCHNRQPLADKLGCINLNSDITVVFIVCTQKNFLLIQKILSSVRRFEDQLKLFLSFFKLSKLSDVIFHRSLIASFCVCQVGNAVPPPLSRAIGLEIKKCILGRIKDERASGDSSV